VATAAPLDYFLASLEAMDGMSTPVSAAENLQLVMGDAIGGEPDKDSPIV